MSRRREPHVSLRVTEQELAVLSKALDTPTVNRWLREKLAEAQKEVRAAKRLANREAKAKRLGGDRTNGVPKEPQSYPPDPVWGRERGRFYYTDYDGESLTIRHVRSGNVWIDKLGEGPVYLRKEDIPLIMAVFGNKDKENQ